MSARHVLVVILFFALAMTSCLADVWYVKQGSSGNGQSWGTAFGSVSSALSAASSGGGCIADNLVTRNTVNYGYPAPGIDVDYGSPTVANNTITCNDGYGIFISGSRATPTLVNNIVANNFGGIYLNGMPVIMNNDVWNNCGDINDPYCWHLGDPETNGNITEDPQFADDVHILWSSPCKDAGLDSVTLPDEFDIDDAARRNGYIDIGADETSSCQHYRLAAALSMQTRFDTSGQTYYDPGPDTSRVCQVNANNYLNTGVSSLRDAATDVFVAGWQSYARAVAYTYQDPTQPWILEEDTALAGSRIAVHDSNLMSEYYNWDFDTVPELNVKFVHNLCTVFPP